MSSYSSSTASKIDCKQIPSSSKIRGKNAIKQRREAWPQAANNEAIRRLRYSQLAVSPLACASGLPSSLAARSHQSTSKNNIIMYENLLERTVVRTNFLNPDVAFSRNERLRCGVGVRESYNTRDVLETTMVVHTNLKGKGTPRYRTIPVFWANLSLGEFMFGVVGGELYSGLKASTRLLQSLVVQSPGGRKEESPWGRG